MRTVKRWLHLHESTTNALLYSRKGTGGLGIPKLATEVPIQRIATLHKFLESTDQVVRGFAEEAGAAAEIDHWCEITGLPHPEKGKRFKPNWREDQVGMWRGLIAQGVGIDSWRGAVSNACLKNHRLLSETNFTNLLKMRTNTYPTRAVLARGRRVPVECRRCGYERETLAHVMEIRSVKRTIKR